MKGSRVWPFEAGKLYMRGWVFLWAEFFGESWLRVSRAVDFRKIFHSGDKVSKSLSVRKLETSEMRYGYFRMGLGRSGESAFLMSGSERPMDMRRYRVSRWADRWFYGG